MNVDLLKAKLRALASPKKAVILQGFFKTGPGQYGEGDRFIGVTVPQIRHIARSGPDLPLEGIRELLRRGVHEERLLGLLILTERFQGAFGKERSKLFKFYLHHLTWVNNWDLVDSSAHHIVGAYLEDKDRSLLDRLAASSRLWDRRVAMVATLHFIRKGQFDDTLRLARSLLNDQEDLMHKAAGWMLREVGKRNEAVLTGFLEAHAPSMPRTMLRYAIERLSAAKKKRFLNKK
ncbi:MAG: DNA alkylation repair protein [Elusimicrobia bacterium]|nr:DNA alkylation repair protein [Elusimicrobiota bacterium]